MIRDDHVSYFAFHVIIFHMHLGINGHLLAFTGNYRQAGLSRYIYELLRRVPAMEEEAEFVSFIGNGPVPERFLQAKPANLKLSQSRLPTSRAWVRIGWEQAALP